METASDDFVKQLMTLPPNERARLAEQLLESLEPSDARNRQLWAEEAERRIDAYENGLIEAIPAQEVFERLNKRFPKE